jgi:nucleotide-binding universal stress UspA family protein
MRDEPNPRTPGCTPAPVPRAYQKGGVVSASARILVAVDLDTRSERVLDEAIELAARSAAELAIVHIVAASSMRDDDWMNSHVELQRLRIRASMRGVRVRTRLSRGALVSGLMAAIVDMAPDVVVVGGDRHGRWWHALLGSIEGERRGLCPMPVLVVPTRPAATEKLRLAAI